MAHPPRLTPRFTVAALLLLAPALAHADTPDSTLDSTERLFKRALTSTQDAPLSKSPDAGQVFTALRSAKDKETLPLFERLRESKVVDNQIFAMVAIALLTKDAKRVDLPLLLSSKDPLLIGGGIASLIDSELLTTDQLLSVARDAKEAAHRVMAIGELARLKKLPDKSTLTAMLADPQNVVRYYAAITLLAAGDPADIAAALAALKEMSNQHDLREAPVQALMLVRAQKENIAAAIPWAAAIAADEAADGGLRYTAVAALLALKGKDGPRTLADMIQKQTSIIQQVKLALISIEYADQLNPTIIEPLVRSRSSLVKSIAAIAQKAVDRGDPTAGLLALIKESHPIVLDWSLAYAERADPNLRLALRTAIVNQATIVDNVRDRDYERAAIAVQKLLDDDGPAGRKTVATLLTSPNRAVVEAALAGIYRSSVEKQADLVMPIWDGLRKSTSAEIAANYAALILAREGRPEPLTWLPGMVDGGQGPGFRALAGWYCSKLKNQTAELLKVALSN